MIEVKECTFEAFSVIGIVGKPNSEGLWTQMNQKGRVLMPLAKRDEDGDMMGAWGLTTEDTLSFRLPTDEHPNLLYMAGLEVNDDAQTPKGFTKWIVPPSDYLYGVVEKQKMETLQAIVEYAEENGWQINGYPQEFMPPQANGTIYLFVPVTRE